MFDGYYAGHGFNVYPHKSAAYGAKSCILPYLCIIFDIFILSVF